MTIAVGMRAGVDAQADVTWWIESTLESRQTTDTVGGKTTTTDSIHNSSNQNSSEGEHHDYTDVMSRNADGTSYNHSTDNHQSPDGSTWTTDRSSYTDTGGTRTVNNRVTEVDTEGNRKTTSTTDQYDNQGRRISHREDTTHDKVEPPKPPKPTQPAEKEPKKEGEKGGGAEGPSRGTPPQPPRPSTPPGRSEPPRANGGVAPAGSGSGARQVELNTRVVCSGHAHRSDGDARIDDDVTVTLTERVVYRSTAPTLAGDCSDYNTGCHVVSHENQLSANGAGTAKSRAGSASWTYLIDDHTPNQETGVWLNFDTGMGGGGTYNCQFVGNANLRTTGPGGFAGVVLRTPQARPVVDAQRLNISFPPRSASLTASAAGSGTADVPGMGTLEMQVSYSVTGGGAPPPATRPRTSETVVPDGEIFPMVIDEPKGRMVGMPLNMGQKVRVHAVGNTIGPVRVRLLRPDGGEMTAISSSAGSFSLDDQTAPTSGTYTIVVESTSGRTGRIDISVTSQ